MADIDANNFPGLVTDNAAIPGMKGRDTVPLSMNDYSVKYVKASLDDLEGVQILQEIETRALRPGSGVVLIDRDKYMCMEQYFIVLRYLEKNR